MQKNTGIIIIAVALALGLAIGYASGARKNPEMNHGSMEGMMSDMNAQLEGKTGDEFDKIFLSEMITHHEGAVAMADAALQNARHQEVKDLAKSIISTQNREIADMKMWQEKWYGTGASVNSAEGAPSGSIHNMPVPAGVSAARKALAQSLKIEENKVVIMTAFPKEWSDSCFGWGGPAESCAAVVTPGYEVTMQAQGKTYVYRTDNAGTVVKEAK